MVLSIDLGAHLLAASYRLAFGQPISSSALHSFANFVGGPGAVLSLGMVTAVSWGFAERISRRARLKDALVCGLAAALTAVVTIQLRWPPVLLWEIVFYHVAGTSGGIVGAGVGRLLYKWLRAEEDILHRAQRGLAEAREANEVAQILGLELGGKYATNLVLLLDNRISGIWTLNDEKADATRLRATLLEDSLMFDEPWILLRIPQKRKRDAGTVLVVPLTTAGGERDGVLAVWFVGRCSSRLRRRFLVTAPAAGLALRVRENERRLTLLEDQRRFARTMHDGCKQDILGAELNLALAQQKLEADEPEFALETLDLARCGIQRAREEIDALVRECRFGSIGTERRLSERLAELGKRIERETGLQVRLEAEDSFDQIAPTMAEELVWVTREAMANIVKHAKATEVRIQLFRAGDTIALEIRDDGAGFDPAMTTLESGYGLTTMRERTEELGGTLLVDSSPDCGTSILVIVPANEG